MRLAIAITTAPRPRETFSRSYRSMIDAGFEHSVLVLSDGALDVQLPQGRCQFSIRVNAPPLGGLKNWCLALELLVTETNAEWLMVCEDDILWARGAAAALAKDLGKLEAVRGVVGYVSLYTSRKVSREIERRRGQVLPPGLYTSGLAGAVWGSQAYVLPRGAAKALLEDATFIDRRANYVKNRNRDGIVSGCLAAMGRRLYYRVPCLVNHELGSANSSLRDKPVQPGLLTDYWTGKP